MRLTLALLGLVLLSESGCARQPLPEAKPPPVQPQTRRSEKPEEPPRIIAPPPAYGNKIVMARRSVAHSL
ncbi:MAG TPA: hypothetical protein VKY73_20465 [Polyangiaceae bacterium]|nr:hypothetical protein [Polyangiaceae bacterium]